MAKCQGWLIRGTGIGNGNYKYFESKTACDEWFKSKQIGTFSNYSVIHGESPDKNHFNVACVHVKLPAYCTQ